MSELKLYAVKNDEGKYWDFSDNDIFWSLAATRCPTTSVRNLATSTANEHGGHVVALVEEPEKVVLTKEQAEIVDFANGFYLPARYISNNSSGEDEDLLMNAYVNGYTVAKEKKYNVKVPHTKDVWYYKASEAYLLTICPEDKKLRGTFTEAEIEHYGLQDCEKEPLSQWEVTDDGTK